MALKDDLARSRNTQFLTLIFDNEVTVTEFVMTPALPWARIVHRQGGLQMAQEYPNVLTAAQAKFEMKNWDEVSMPDIMRNLPELGDAVDYVVIGNNAGQGLPLAQALPLALRASHAAIIYANSLPEQSAYERLGYRVFCRRRQLTEQMSALAQNARRPLALYFVNTIQHNELNYHDP